eukprot:CAMPEP_0178921006 /NCGR_PEP_ID=MMETSP0786-20121207/15315_1 /TAXON_ID=186022 /ORGANISM="Thalassionema frauenfeldii, Strain CCMP 1798" /LENGTH=284 /DNA_ID=CAMNT_0020595125 /DNA_START=123 /DNA_END=977 /DNA_ORIENTATION=+
MSVLKDLRSKSGAPMVECKKALESSDNDIDAAVEWLRKHGAAKTSSKVAGREAQEGLVGVLTAGKSAAIVQVASETDFAGRSKAFSDLVEHITSATLQSSLASEIDSKDLMSIAVDGKTVEEAMEDAILSIRENLKVKSALSCVADDGLWVGYVHGRVSDAAGSAAAIVNVSGDVSEQVLQEVGKKLAMHVVAARPLFMNPESVPDDVVAKETEILREQIAETIKNKPPDIVEKIIAGKLRKYYETVCLTEQAHMILEGNPKVKKSLKEQGVKLIRFEFKGLHH